MSSWRHYFLLLCYLFLCLSCEKEKEGRVVFIGDSLVKGWKIKKYFSNYDLSNEGVSGAVIEDVLNWDINATDKTAVYLIGTNNLGAATSLPLKFNNYFIDHYLHVIYTLNAESNIVISLLPRQPSAHRPTINEEIKLLNKELKETFASYDHIEFLDVYDYFTEEDNINHTYFHDGLHLNTEGYNLLSKLLAPVLEKNTAILKEGN